MRVPETVRTRKPELDVEERRLANLVDFIGEGRGSRALAKAPAADGAEGRGAPPGARTVPLVEAAGVVPTLDVEGVEGSAISRRLQPTPRDARSWWTRTQSIRTAGALPIEVALVDTSAPPAYQIMASKAVQLRELGLSDRRIASRLGVTDKTVAKAIRWLRGTLLH